MNIQELAQEIHKQQCRSTERVPGYTATVGEEQAAAYAVREFIGAEQPVETSHALGKALVASGYRNQGNMNASYIIAKTLKSFSGQHVTEEVGEVLKLLEDFLIRVGDMKEDEEEVCTG